jgi:hypothetical protein
LALLGIALVQTVLLGVCLAIGVGGMMAAAVVSIRHFEIGQPLATIILIGAVLLWIPAFFLAMRASSMVAQALSPRSATVRQSRVEISGLSIESVRTGVPVEKVLWSDLQEVHIVNEDAWPIGTQYWLLIGRNRTGAVVPSDADGAPGTPGRNTETFTGI